MKFLNHSKIRQGNQQAEFLIRSTPLKFLHLVGGPEIGRVSLMEEGRLILSSIHQERSGEFGYQCLIAAMDSVGLQI